MGDVRGLHRGHYGFRVINARWLGADRFALWVWLTPSIIGVPTIVLGSRYYRRKFSLMREPRKVITSLA